MDAYAQIASASGSRVGPATALSEVDGHQVVLTPPGELATAAGVELDTYSLARMIASEQGSGPAPYWLALAELGRNAARHRGVSVTALLTHSPHPGRSGYYGRQTDGRFAATSQDPSGRHLVAAQLAMAGSAMFGLARDWFDPRSQDRGSQAGHRLRLTSEQYVERNAASGLFWLGPVVGIDAYHLMMFGPTPGGGDALAELARGRKRTAFGVGALVAIGIVAVLFLSGAL